MSQETSYRGKPGYRFFSNVDADDLQRYKDTAQYLGFELHTEQALSADGTLLPNHIALYIPKNISWDKFFNEVPH